MTEETGEREKTNTLISIKKGRGAGVLMGYTTTHRLELYLCRPMVCWLKVRVLSRTLDNTLDAPLSRLMGITHQEEENDPDRRKTLHKDYKSFDGCFYAQHSVTKTVITVRCRHKCWCWMLLLSTVMDRVVRWRHSTPRHFTRLLSCCSKNQ